MPTHSSKPVCPNCESHLVLFRAKDDTLGCRRCGHRWGANKATEIVAGQLADLIGQAMETGQAEGHGMRITNLRFIPPEEREK